MKPRMLYISLDLTDMWEHKRDMWVYVSVAPKANMEMLMGEPTREKT